MARQLRVASAQLGPIHLADDRKAVVARLCAMLREAHGMGAKLVVFPELALTTFFPRYWYDDMAEIDGWFEREMPNAATQPLFDLARDLGVGFYLGYAELALEHGVTHRYNTSIIVAPDGQIVGKYRKVHLPGHADHREGIPFQHLVGAHPDRRQHRAQAPAPARQARRRGLGGARLRARPGRR
jgi:predicted amidohydrolase